MTGCCGETCHLVRRRVNDRKVTCRPIDAGVRMWALAALPSSNAAKRMSVLPSGFNRSMQRFGEIAQPVCRSLVFFGDVR